MANVMLGFPNLVDLGNLSGGNWSFGLPLSNLQFRQIGRVARTASDDIADTQFVIDMLQDRSVRLVALVNHNMSFGAQWIVEAANDINFTDIVYQSTNDAWAALTNAEWVLEELEWESDNFWLGTYSLDEVEGLTALAFHILPNVVSARYWRFRIIDTGNASGYVQIGRPFLGAAFQPNVNMSYGASIGYEDTSGVETSLGGAEYFDERDPYRVMRFSLGYMDPATEGFAEALELTRRAGVVGELLVIFDPDDALNAQRLNFLGRMRTLSPLEMAFYNTTSMAFEIKEIK